MKALRLLGKIGLFLVISASLATADSLQLRNGGHLQGRYVGGTTTMVGFMTAGTIQYFVTSDILALIFDSNSDTPLSGLQPNPMKGRSSANKQHTLTLQKIHHAQGRAAKPRVRATLISSSFAHPAAKVEAKREPASGSVQTRKGATVVSQ